MSCCRATVVEGMMVSGWVDDEKSQRWMKGSGGDVGKNGIIVGHRRVQSQSPSLSAADCCNHLHKSEAVEVSRDSFHFYTTFLQTRIWCWWKRRREGAR